MKINYFYSFIDLKSSQQKGLKISAKPKIQRQINKADQDNCGTKENTDPWREILDPIDENFKQRGNEDIRRQDNQPEIFQSDNRQMQRPVTDPSYYERRQGENQQNRRPGNDDINYERMHGEIQQKERSLSDQAYYERPQSDNHTRVIRDNTNYLFNYAINERFKQDRDNSLKLTGDKNCQIDILGVIKHRVAMDTTEDRPCCCAERHSSGLSCSFLQRVVKFEENVASEIIKPIIASQGEALGNTLFVLLFAVYLRSLRML